MTKKEQYKAQRIRVWNKYDNKCAYCGKDIELNKMQIDHKNPIFRGSTDAELEHMNITRGLDNESNYMPSCSRCNKWKSTYTLENFRKEINMQIIRLKKISNYNMATDFNLVYESNKPVIFYFEKVD